MICENSRSRLFSWLGLYADDKGDPLIDFSCTSSGIKYAIITIKQKGVYDSAGDITSCVGIESSVDEEGASYKITNNSD